MNNNSGSKFSRKEFLGLLGTGAGALMLPGDVSAKDAATESMLPPILKNRKTRISFRYFLPWAPAWGDQNFADQRLEELVRFGHEAGIDSVQFFVNTFRHTYYALPVDVESQQPWIDWMREIVAPRVRAEGFGFELNFQQLLGATTSNTDLRSLYKWNSSWWIIMEKLRQVRPVPKIRFTVRKWPRCCAAGPEPSRTFYGLTTISACTTTARRACFVIVRCT